MNNRFDEAEAAEFVDRYADAWGEQLALRLYTTRLIGQDRDLVLHGGGNTSVKTEVRDRFRDETIAVMHVTGSGSDLGSIEPAGLPAVELEPLQSLRGVDRMSDEDMVNQLRTRLLDASAKTPSVETLLHAFLPHRFVDHTHADAILCLTDQLDAEEFVRSALGDDVVILPWIMSGCPLANAVADAFDAKPDCEGIVLLKHGLVTFGDDARSSYDRMIDLVDRAERWIARRTEGVATMLTTAEGASAEPTEFGDFATEVLPVVRGALALPPEPGADSPRRFVADWRSADDLVAFSRHLDCRLLCAAGPLTPDHVIRTKGTYLVLAAGEARDPERVRAAVARYADEYRGYFEANRDSVPGELTMLDPHPRVVVVEGGGILAFGADARAAGVAADIAEHTLRCKAAAVILGDYEPLTFAELFAMEYWSLEQAKLGKDEPSALAGQIALITGAAGAIGAGVAETLLAAGAHVLATDVRADDLQAIVQKLRQAYGAHRVAGVVMDVTDAQSVREGMHACCAQFGGLDILVPNAGTAYVSSLAEMDEARFKKVIDINLNGTMLVLRESAKIFERQGTGGSVVLQSSKNVFDPGAGFGAYSASKAGAHQLGKIAALELAPLGVRVNMVNADAVFGDAVPSGLWEEIGPERMRSRGLDPDGLRAYYRDRSLLKVDVLPRHVGAAVVFFASAATPTTGATLPVDAGVPGAFPR